MFYITQDSIGIESNICMFQIFVLDSLGEFQIFAPGPAQMFQDSRESIPELPCHLLCSSLHLTSGLRTTGFWKHRCGRERDYLEE